MDYKKEITNIINTHGKRSASKIIKKNHDLWSEIDNKTKFITSNNSMEKITAYMQDMTSITCKNNSQLKYNDGKFSYCGRSNKCECAKESVSKSVSIAKRNRSKEDIESENKKRSDTTYKKYGVRNNAQTEKAKKAHKDFYKDKDNVKKSLAKLVGTLMEKYSVSNAYHIDGVNEKKIKTLQKKYNLDVTNPQQVKEIAEKALLTRLKNGRSIESKEKSYNKIVERFNIDYNITILNPIENYDGITSLAIIDARCNKCNHEFTTRLDYGFNPKCPICDKKCNTFRSKEEIEVGDFISSIYDKKIILNDRSLIKPLEVDIYLPESKIAIEYCGLYWHQENMGKDKNYHRNKFLLLQSQGIQLITIFSDEWNNKKDIVKSRLTTILSKNNNTIGARKFSIKEVSYKEAKVFLDYNHIQGSSVSKFNIALVDDNNTIYSLMTFSNRRIALGGKKLDNEYELLRFANLIGHTIPGAASKLLTFFIKKYDPKSIISYADLRWSIGNLYNKLSFNQLIDEPIGYFYMDDYTKRYNRFSFRKSILTKMGMPNELTEFESMDLLGYSRIWDCGIRKFVLDGDNIKKYKS